MTPIVDGLEETYGEAFSIVRADIVRYPTVPLLDSKGEQVGALRGMVPRPSMKQRWWLADSIRAIRR